MKLSDSRSLIGTIATLARFAAAAARCGSAPEYAVTVVCDPARALMPLSGLTIADVLGLDTVMHAAKAIEAVVDPQGKTVQSALEHIGFTGVGAVHVGKYLEIELPEGNAETCEDPRRALSH